MQQVNLLAHPPSNGITKLPTKTVDQVLHQAVVALQHA
jgi:hypothetical protein